MKESENIGYHEKYRRYHEKVIRLHFGKGLSYHRIGRIIPLSEVSIRRWCINFASSNKMKTGIMEKEESKTKLFTSGTTDQEKDIKSLQAEIKRLEKELKHEKMRADAYDMMIEIAEARFNIPIRKKSGAKQ
jgi:hypothetical protein